MAAGNDVDCSLFLQRKDHLHQSSGVIEFQVMRQYLLSKRQQQEAENCRHLSKSYLECRMERNLMAKQDLSELLAIDLSDGLFSRKLMEPCFRS
ncbi:hypothetical protein GOP47_0027278 [Adiantum capillus-veneris]|nr:hypothetical protein GOP47_0027278 [Adiantum capillus-veneris]